MNEATMTDADMKQREKIVKSMKKKFSDFRSRYGAKAKEVMYATATKMAMKEAVKDAADKGEYDYEGDMAKSSLRTIVRNAQMMHDMLDENTNLPEWVASKVTLAEDYIVAATQYMQSEMNEAVEMKPQGTLAAAIAAYKKKPVHSPKQHAQQIPAVKKPIKKSTNEQTSLDEISQFKRDEIAHELRHEDEENYRQEKAYRRRHGVGGPRYNKPASSNSSHAVHINGKKWKSFSSHAHASAVAKKIEAKGGNKKITVHKEGGN